MIKKQVNTFLKSWRQTEGELVEKMLGNVLDGVKPENYEEHDLGCMTYPNKTDYLVDGEIRLTIYEPTHEDNKLFFKYQEHWKEQYLPNEEASRLSPAGKAH